VLAEVLGKKKNGNHALFIDSKLLYHAQPISFLEFKKKIKSQAHKSGNFFVTETP
jgi:hypothetical protein